MFFYLPAAKAIGVTPGITWLNYTPGVSVDVSFTTYNGDSDPMYVKIIKGDGDLVPYIYCDREEEVSIEVPPQSGYLFDCDITAPDGLAPGGHVGQYGIVGVVPENVNSGGATVGIVTGSLTRVEMVVPYADKYISTTYSFENSVEGEDMPYVISIKNYGTKALTAVQPSITLLNGNGEQVLVQSEDAVALITNQDKAFKGTLATGSLAGGLYTVKLSVTYDGEEKEYTTTVRIGNKMLLVTDFSPLTIPAVGISKIPVVVESNWVEDVQGYAELVFSKNGEEKAWVKTDTQTVQSGANATLSGFFEPEETGTYDVEVTTYTVDGVTYTKTFEGVVDVASDSNMMLYVGIAAAFIIICLVGYLVLQKKKK